MAANRIICIGNRYHGGDCAGPLTHAELTLRQLPGDLEVIDGGIAGLNLLPLIEGAERVVFVDSLLEDSGEVRNLAGDDPALEPVTNYGHGAGLGYLLRMLPASLGSCIPETHVVGIPGEPAPQRIAAAADLCLELASGRRRSQALYSGGAR